MVSEVSAYGQLAPLLWAYEQQNIMLEEYVDEAMLITSL
jgi:hypothetical protein